MTDKRILNVNFKTGEKRPPIDEVANSLLTVQKALGFDVLNDDFCGYKIFEIYDFMQELIQKSINHTLVPAEIIEKSHRAEKLEKILLDAALHISDEGIRNAILERMETK